jgi:tetratricopeptide (TPR) repeat protein
MKYNMQKLNITTIALSLMLINQCTTPVLAARSPNEIPLYAGGLTPEQQKANEQLIAGIDHDRLAHGMSRAQCAQDAITRGWQYLNSADPLSAIKRFNQAWLLDPNNANVYWGLGSAQSALGEYQDGINLISRAAKLDKNNADIVTDMGRCYMFWGAKTKDNKQRQELLDKAIREYQEALKVDPKSGNAYSNWAYAQFFNGNYTAAWQMVTKAREFGGKGLDSRFLRALAAKLPEPK